jgi:A/G-specific adenine glycosylase
MTDFHRLITEWYRLNKRDLPWRNTNNPYFIWLSEIILQQTRVAQGLSYYLKFIKHYPTVVDLANASEQDVLNDWQGLGYYSRARNLHATAKIISAQFDGIFPDKHDQILKLKGVGEYTAAAISSFSFNLPYSVVDGNVYRVLSRVFDIDLPIDSSEGKKFYAKLAQELLEVGNPAIHNQAIMELGAVQCVPSNPECVRCPLNEKCLALSAGTIDVRPIKSKKTKVRNRYFHFMIFQEDDKTILEKRKAKDIWQHLYQFPLIETLEEKSFHEMKLIFKDQLGFEPLDFSKQEVHILSHQKIFAHFYFFNTFPKEFSTDLIVISQNQIQDFPLPRLIDRYLETFVF